MESTIVAQNLDWTILRVENLEKTKGALIDAGRIAIEDGAEALVLGCGGLPGVDEPVGNELGVSVHAWVITRSQETVSSANDAEPDNSLRLVDR